MGINRLELRLIQYLKIKGGEKMKKLNGKSMDLVQENIKKLKEIFPEVFVEGEVNFGVLRQIFGGGVDSSKERYSQKGIGK